ncbi:FAD-dependent oxidoreductase [Paenibacillaceae bacterium]|nr:FAD-dependent oxidoreductase [Paenibacillaceae bacterium]
MRTRFRRWMPVMSTARREAIMQLSQLINKQAVRRPLPSYNFTENYDVIIVGLGTAGAIAAITAGRSGLRVLGIERMNAMGGTGTSGAVLNYYFGSKGGLYEQLDEAVAALEKQGYTKSNGINSELKKVVLEREALLAGCKIAYESSVTGVYLDGNRVLGLRWAGPEGTHSTAARFIIDCTGNAEVCAAAGCATRMGRELDGMMQPYSNAVMLVEGKRVKHYYTDAGYVDATDARAMSAAIIDSSTLPTHLMENYEDSRRLLRTAPLLGIRESRCIVGEENVTLPAYLSGKVTSKPIFYAYSNLDSHSKDMALESETLQDWSVVASLWGMNLSIPVPLGALIPRGFDGLLTAGRCIALDHDFTTAIRMKRDMQKCGEAAAAAVSIAMKDGIAVRDIDYNKLLAVLTTTGCYRKDNDVGMKDTQHKEDEHNRVVGWMSDVETIRAGLDSTKPGIAIWSAKRLDHAIRPDLRLWMLEAGREHLRKHSALALGLLGDPLALPVLRSIVRERDAFVPQTSRKYNIARALAAIYLLGKLQDQEMVPDLVAVADSRGEWGDGYHNDEFINDREELDFQYYSFSIMALLRIGEGCSSLRADIAAKLNALTKERELSILLKSCQAHGWRYPMSPIIRRAVHLWLKRWS